MQNIANQLPDAFTNLPRITKSHIPAVNAPVRVDIPTGQIVKANESRPHLKRGRPIGSKDKNPQKRKGINDQDDDGLKEISQDETQVITHDDEEVRTSENNEISINYVSTRKLWNRNNVVIDNIFAYNVAIEIMQQDEDFEPKSVHECRQRNDWPKWKDAIQAELASLEKREVFGPIIRTPEGIKPVGYKWVFCTKKNEKGEVMRYNARLVAQGFSQRPDIDYMETYSPLVDAITFRYLINMEVHEKLEMRLMDVVTAYLYGSLDHNIFMKIPEAFKVPETYKDSRETCSIKLQKSLYGLKQSERMWYNRLSEYLLKKGYKNDPICPCIFI